MSNTLGLPAQALFQDVFLRGVQGLEILGVHDVLRPIFHKFHPSARADRDEILLGNLLLEIVLADDAKETPFNLLKRLGVDSHVIVVEIELIFFVAEARFHIRGVLL